MENKNASEIILTHFVWWVWIKVESSVSCGNKSSYPYWGPQYIPYARHYNPLLIWNLWLTADFEAQKRIYKPRVIMARVWYICTWRDLHDLYHKRIKKYFYPPPLTDGDVIYEWPHTYSVHLRTCCQSTAPGGHSSVNAIEACNYVTAPALNRILTGLHFKILQF